VQEGAQEGAQEGEGVGCNMPDDTLARLQEQLADSEAKKQKMEQQAKNYVEKLKRDHKTDKERLESELQENKALLTKALQDAEASRRVIPADGGSDSGGNNSEAIATRDAEILRKDLSATKDQAKIYVKALVTKHKEALEKCEAEKLHLEQALHAAHASGESTIEGGRGDSSEVLGTEHQRIKTDLEQTKEQAKSYVKKLMEKHKTEMEENAVALTELQEQVNNLKADAEAHNLAMNAKDEQVHNSKAKMHDVQQQLAAALETADNAASSSSAALQLLSAQSSSADSTIIDKDIELQVNEIYTYMCICMYIFICVYACISV